MPAAMPDTNAPAPAAAPQDTMLENTEWSLVELGGKPMLGAGNRPLTLRLDPAGKRASGFAGCNRYSGSYELAGNSLKFGPTIMTKMACDQGMDAEAAWADVLGRVTAWRIAGGNLELLAGDAVLAKFRAAA
jgi:heat shock protein HslJ